MKPSGTLAPGTEIHGSRTQTPEGWVCPLCLRVLPPWERECPCCGKPPSNADWQWRRTTLGAGWKLSSRTDGGK